MRMTYLIGEPGVGKSTLMAELTAGLGEEPWSRPFARTAYPVARVVALGKSREGGFPGTDALSMSVQPQVLEWLRMPEYYDIIGEGDRLANESFFQAVLDMGWDLTIVALEGAEIAAERRARRAEQLGEGQNNTWVRGRITKVARLTERWADVRLDATLPLSALVIRAGAIPVFDRLEAARARAEAS